MSAIASGMSATTKHENAQSVQARPDTRHTFWMHESIESQIQQELKKLKSAEQEHNALSLEIGKALLGQSTFSADNLAQALQETEVKIRDCQKRITFLQAELHISQGQTSAIEKRLSKLTWEDLFALCDRETKKMVVCHLIHRVFVFRDYAMCLELNFQICSDNVTM